MRYLDEEYVQLELFERGQLFADTGSSPYNHNAQTRANFNLAMDLVDLQLRTQKEGKDKAIQNPFDERCLSFVE